MSAQVVMLDVEDGTLHVPRIRDPFESGPGEGQMTHCGLALMWIVVGPIEDVGERASRRCPDCFPEGTP